MTRNDILTAILAECLRINGATDYRATFRIEGASQILNVFVVETGVALRLDTDIMMGRGVVEPRDKLQVLVDKLKTFV